MAGAGSTIALTTYFEAGDPRFLAEVQRSDAALVLGNLALRWLGDRRPELRRMLLEYVDGGLERPNHQPLVKRLFKGAEAARDHELMAHLLVACDRLCRRQLKTVTRWDWTTRTASTEQLLKQDKRIPRGRAPTAGMAPENGQPPRPKRGRHLDGFTYSTRRYLVRRAWRYLRELSAQDPEAYLLAATTALQLYQDEHLATPTQLLDSWGLVHLLYHHNPILEPARAGWTVREGADLSGLAPAPYLPELWARSPAPLFDLLVRARARTVRLFAMEQLRSAHAAALQRLDFEVVRRLLSNTDPEVQTFAASLLEHASGVALLPVEEWLKLLEIQNPAALPVLCEQFARYVAPDRVQDAQLLSLAASPAAPVASLAVEWLAARPVKDVTDLEARLALVRIPAQVARRAAIQHLLVVGQAVPYIQAKHLRELLDAPFADVREAGLDWMAKEPRFAKDLSLWAALSETPYDDVRAVFLSRLSEMQDNLPSGSILRVWTSVILAVHRGSRAKAHAVRQVAERVVNSPSQAKELLPLLQVGLRSLRAPERKGALAAVTRAAFMAPAFRELLFATLPELKLEPLSLDGRAP